MPVDILRWTVQDLWRYDLLQTVVTLTQKNLQYCEVKNQDYLKAIDVHKSNERKYLEIQENDGIEKDLQKAINSDLVKENKKLIRLGRFKNIAIVVPTALAVYFGIRALK